MQFKDAMLFQAKIYRKQNAQLLALLSGLTDEQRRAHHPGLADGSITANLDDMINNAIFTINSLALSCIDKAAHAARFIDGEVEGRFGPMPHPRSFADEPFEVLSDALLELSEKYVEIYAACDEAELTASEGLAPYDFASKGFCIAFELRGEIYALLREQGLFTAEHPFDGPLAD